MNNNQIIKETIREKIEKKDANKYEFLILKLNNEEVIFVFSNKVSSERWNWLEPGKEYSFTVKEGKNGNKLLVDFEIEINA